MARSIKEVENAAIAHEMALTGAERADRITYYQGALRGAYGPISEPGRNWIRRILTAMGEIA